MIQRIAVSWRFTHFRYRSIKRRHEVCSSTYFSYPLGCALLASSSSATSTPTYPPLWLALPWSWLGALWFCNDLSRDLFVLALRRLARVVSGIRELSRECTAEPFHLLLFFFLRALRLEAGSEIPTSKQFPRIPFTAFLNIVTITCCFVGGSTAVRGSAENLECCCAQLLASRLQWSCYPWKNEGTVKCLTHPKKWTYLVKCAWLFESFPAEIRM